MRRTVALWTVLVAAAGAAQTADPPPLVSEQPALPLLGQAARTAAPAQRLPLLDRALALLLQPTPLRGAVLCERAATLQRLGRDAEAREGYEQCRQLRPDDPRVLIALAFGKPSRTSRSPPHSCCFARSRWTRMWSAASSRA